MRRIVVVVSVLAVAALTAACVGPSGDTGGAASRSASAATSGDTPSASARMICQSEAEDEIAAALGVQPSRPPTPTWADHLYSCRYVYPSAVMVLSVKELPDAAATSAYFTSVRNSLTSSAGTEVLGLDAFTGPDGSIVVRKDFKVLDVDVKGLPDTFGQPPGTRAHAAFTVAAVIMGCWTGG